MRRYTKLAAMAATAVVMALGLCGCGSSSSSSSSSGSGSDYPLTVGAYDPPTVVANFNPYSPMANGFIVSMVYAPLWGYNVLQDSKVDYFLAKDFSWSTDAKTLTIHLVPNLTWSDGSPLTSKDVAFSFNYASQNGITPVKFASIDTPDDTTVVAHFANASRSQEESISTIPIVPQAVWKSIKDPTSVTNATPIGSGPYTVEKTDTQMVQLKARSDYFKPVPVHTVQVVIANSDTINQQLLAGEIQWTSAAVPNEQSNFVDKDPSTNHMWVMGTAEKNLMVNTQKAPFNNVDFRKGLSLSLNRQKIADAYNKGWTEPVGPTGLSTQYSASWIKSGSQYTDPIKQDTSAAKAEFAKAGYTEQNGKLVGADGKQMTMNMIVQSDYSDTITYAREICNELQAVGINANVETVPDGQWTSDMNDGNFDAAIVSASYGSTPYTFYSRFLSNQYYAPTGYNYAKWNDPATQAAFTEFLNATDTATQKDAMYKIEDIMVNEVPMIPLTTAASVGTYISTHWTGWPTADNPYAEPVVWAGTTNTLETILHLKPVSK